MAESIFDRTRLNEDIFYQHWDFWHNFGTDLTSCVDCWNRETGDTVHKAETFVISPSNCAVKCTKLAIICDPGWRQEAGIGPGGEVKIGRQRLKLLRGRHNREARVQALEKKTRKGDQGAGPG